MGRKKYSVGTLCFKKYCFCRKKIMLWTFFSPALQSEKKNFDSKKNHSPPPFKLNDVP